MTKEIDLLHLLSDGKFHSGEDLGGHLHVTRSAVWKIINNITQRLGVDIYKVSGKGYALASPLELLNAEDIHAALGDSVKKQLGKLEILPTVDSTNRYVWDGIRKQPMSGFACFAEHQSQGRGRRGRQWHSPFGHNLFMSVSFQFSRDVMALQGLSLAMAVAVAGALEAYGLEDVQLKWPNDVYSFGKKLAGILVEMQAVMNVDTWVVVGVGLNVAMPELVEGDIAQPWTDVASIMGQKPSRNQLAALVLQYVFSMLTKYEQQGFSVCRDDWQRLDMAHHQTVSIISDHETVVGIAQGVTEQGALIVDVEGELRHFLSGDVSLRLSDG